MRFRCRACGPLPAGLEWEATGNEQCPKCGRSTRTHPYVVHELTDVHFIVRHADGPILGNSGRLFVACERKRDALARHMADSYAASDDPRAVTCPACKRTREFLEMARLFPELRGDVPSGGLEITRPCC